ncbi:peptide-N4-(N-acetyl-beta-glucosaminyl)asparagine amidase A-like [Gossypium australe]|uniref:Peptide-N4-(N-acetyl-beta-glucosaminyl)asparagine amidase A-like n=1 Tax=Gossypium australe TaxID=47621 RepID=A0A5B6VTU8_9ROSI|nr:peptide-N4-(N-acetyl-beta-glucosaminyl)asparagine amidase A-like [Gossypium australe]
MASFFFPLLFFLLQLFLYPLFGQSNLHQSKTFLKSTLFSQPSSTNDTIPPTPFFEVTKPINVPNTKPCSLTVLQHDFGYTYGVELLRSCTAEPKATGIVWSDKKDVTQYSSLLLMNKTQTFAVYMGNLVDQTYTGVYHVNVSLYFCPAVEKANLGSGIGSKADLIIPFSKDLPLNDGLWYKIENSTDIKVKEFEIPQNVYQVVLEVYESFHENDEYGNPPSGIIPQLWRPISAIGSFDLPTYEIEITPFLGFGSKTKGKLLHHSIAPLSVSSVIDVEGLNGTFVTKATRSISSTGWIKSSYGTITTKSTQDLSYRNSMVMAKDGNLQIVNQKIHFDDRVHSKMPGFNLKPKKSLKRFVFNIYSDYINQGNGTSLTVANVTLGFNEKKFKYKVRNLQKGNGFMVVKDNLVVNGVGNTQQIYKYGGFKYCYCRNVSSSNYTILYDEIGYTCSRRAKHHLDYGP